VTGRVGPADDDSLGVPPQASPEVGRATEQRQTTAASGWVVGLQTVQQLLPRNLEPRFALQLQYSPREAFSGLCSLRAAITILAHAKASDSAQ